MSGKVLGSITAWEIPTGLVISFAELKAKLAATGHDTGIARELLPHNAFARAARSLKKENIVRLLEKDERYVKFQFTKEFKHSGVLEYEKEAILVLDKDTGKVHCPESATLEAAATAELDRCIQSRTAADVNRLVRVLFEKGTDVFMFKKRSGVYFLPSSNDELLEKTAALVRELGGAMNVLTIPEDHASPATRRSVYEVVRSGLAALVQEHLDAVKAFGGPDAGGERAMHNTIERIQESRLKVESYRGFLADEVEALDAKLKGAKQELATRLAAAMNAEPQLLAV